MARLPHFIRRFIRQYTKRKDPIDADIKRSRWSIAYMLIAWNFLGYLIYQRYVASRSRPETKNLSDGRYFTQLMNQQNVKLVKYSGISKVGEWDLEEEKNTYGHLLTKEELAEVELHQKLDTAGESQSTESPATDEEWQ